MFCVNCGASVQSSNFCEQCGAHQPASSNSSIGSATPSASSNFQDAGLGLRSRADRLKKKRPLLVLWITIGALVAVTSVSFLFIPALLQGNPFKNAIEVCGLEGAPGVELADDDKTLEIDTEGDEDYFGASYDDLACMVSELDFPSRVITRMDNTRALDGQLTDEFDGLVLYWSYHPDTGINLIVNLK